ncbi:hypothetical protein [Occallatibacter savannae]|uniref:hypothetical protein n=1 Tax=Occallatibacter savannae TaxID=1002691 RepID=UPI0013A58680|nr:hypothetical protein [Occallatibacter savannae]
MASSLLSSPLICQSDHVPGATLRSYPARLLAIWHLTSLDAPSVAVVWAYAIAHTANIRLEPWIALLLATGTWTVYVVDRILDARRAISSNTPAILRERHHFHWRHRRLLTTLASCTGLTAAAIIVRLMPVRAREHDSIIAAAALAYFSGVHSSARFPAWLRRLCSKEMLVGILFAAGCAAPTLTRIHSASPWPAILSLSFLAGLAWLNCAAIARWESHISSTRISVLALTIALSGFAIAAALPPGLARTSALFFCASASALMIAALDCFRHRIDAVTLRALADLVLLAPAFLLFARALPA